MSEVNRLAITLKLREQIEYWRMWNIPPRPGITEGAGDCAARQLAQMFYEELLTATDTRLCPDCRMPMKPVGFIAQSYACTNYDCDCRGLKGTVNPPGKITIEGKLDHMREDLRWLAKHLIDNTTVEGAILTLQAVDAIGKVLEPLHHACLNDEPWEGQERT